MKIGFGIPIRAGIDLRHDVTRFARDTEQAGATSLWVYERVLWPVNPTSGMYGVPGLPWDDFYSEAADALTVLTLAAAVTENVRLGTSVLIAPFHVPVHLARTLATLDQASGGRVVAGLGSGWSPDEYKAMGADFGRRGAVLDEVTDALRALWADGPTTYHDSRTALDNSFVRPKPVSTIPVMFGGGASEKAIARIAEKGDGWLPADPSAAFLKETWDKIRDGATAHGRDASKLELIAQANVVLTDTPIEGDGRYPFKGSWEQVIEDMAGIAEAGAHEIIVVMSPSSASGKEVLDLSLEALDRLKAAGIA
jgi:probable F420-dependent oxidoreductase